MEQSGYIIGLLFDVDGVIADTPHEEAWKSAAVARGLITQDFVFSAFYAEHVAGEPGDKGAYAILARLPEAGQAYFDKKNIREEEERRREAAAFRLVKQGYLDQCINKGEFKVYDDVGKLILQAKRAGVPVGAVSASENARKILQKISAQNLADHVGVNSSYADQSLYEIFDSVTLGTKTHWHDTDVNKLRHYDLARGMLVGKAHQRGLWWDEADPRVPYIIVFEDAVRGISAISPKDYFCIGISRMSKTGQQPVTKQDLLNAGARLAYDEEDLKGLDYSRLRSEIEKLLL